MAVDADSRFLGAFAEIDRAAVDEATKRHERQAKWRDKGVQRIRAARQKRLMRLQKETEAIDRATRAYAQADVGDVPVMQLRGTFVRLDTPRAPRRRDRERQKPDAAARRRAARQDLDSRPPLARLVHRDTRSLALYMTAVYVAHLETGPGNAFVNRHDNVFKQGDRASWVTLAGMSTPLEEHARRNRIRRALDGLEAAGLARLKPKGRQGRYDAWGLLKDDGSTSVYRVPGAASGRVVRLPAAFFYNGWHLVLDPPEIAMLLAIVEMSRFAGVLPDSGQNGLPGVAFPEKARWARYGITGEVYEAAHQLHEFDLVNMWDPMPNRRRGKVSPKRPALPAVDSSGDGNIDRVPYWFYPPALGAFDRKALEVVTERLTLFDIPYRLDDNGDLITPAELAKLYAAHKQQTKGTT